MIIKQLLMTLTQEYNYSILYYQLQVNRSFIILEIASKLFTIFLKSYKSMSYTRQLLYSIADSMNRNRKQMDPFINLLQKNWYDTQQALQTLTLNDYDKYDIPRRLSSLIMERVGSVKQQQPQQFQNYPQQQYQQPNHQYNQQSQYSQHGNQKSSNMMEEQISVFRILQKLKAKSQRQKFNEIIDSLTKIFRNIRENITQQKYRVLKKNNQKVADLLSNNYVCQILMYGGFEDSQDTIVMKNVSLGKLDDCIDNLSKFNESVKFDPYKSQITNISGNKSNFEGQTTSAAFNEKLKQLEQKRERIMSMPIKDRQIKIYKSERKQLKPDASWNDERQLNETEKQYSESIKQKLKSYGEDPKFMNRRKQQYFDLMKKPCFSETLVRVKLPDNWIFQCKFSPLETLEELVKIFHEFVENKNLSYYLYMTPPVEKLSGIVLRQTFYDKGCVPTAIFYFGSNQTITGHIMKQKKGSLLGMFN